MYTLYTTNMYVQLAVTLIVCALGVKGEVRFVCPTPQSPAANNQNGSCMGGDSYIQVSPGYFTIHIEEPVIHSKTPLMVRLFDKKTPDIECILLDNIPHNENLITKIIPVDKCTVDSGPIGSCGTSSYLTIQIPDITCDSCVLKVTQIVTNGSSCSRWTDRNNDCTLYHTCANIKIRPSDKSSTDTTEKCRGVDSYTALKWKQTKTVIAYEPLYNSKFLFNDVAMKFIDSGDSINFDIRFPPAPYSVQNIQVFRWATARSAMKIYAPVEAGHFVGFIPPSKLAKFRTNLAVIKVQYDGVLLTTSGKLFRGTVYAPTGVSYTNDGWLTGDTFVGENATYSEVVTPQGRCASPHGQYSSGLRNSSDGLAGMILYKTTPQRMHISAILPYNQVQVDWNVKYTNTPDVTDVPYVINTKNVLFGTLPITAGNIQTFTVKESKGTRNMSGTVTQSVQAYLWEEKKLQGMAMLTLESKKTIRIQYFLNNFGSTTPSPLNISLTGPPKDMAILHLDAHKKNAFAYGGWPYEKLADVKNAEIGVAYWAGYLGLESIRPKTRFYYFNTFSLPSRGWCVGVDHIICDVMELKSSSDINGLASLVATSNTSSVAISALIREVPLDSTVSRIYVTDNKGDVIEFKKDFVPISQQSHTLFLGHTSANITMSQASALVQGTLLLKVVIKLAVPMPDVVLQASIPPPKYIYGGPYSKNEPLTTQTKSPATEPPTTKPPTTDPPTTKPPTTEQPTTKPPTTEPPTTKPPTTKPPTTKPPTTKPPTTKPPTTKPPTTKPPTTKPPTTKPPTTKPPTTKPPTTRPPTTKPPITKPPTTKPPTTKSSTIIPTTKPSITTSKLTSKMKSTTRPGSAGEVLLTTTASASSLFAKCPFVLGLCIMTMLFDLLK